MSPMAASAIVLSLNMGAYMAENIREEGTPEEFFEHPKDKRLKEFMAKII